MGPMPLSPRNAAAHASITVLPSGQTMPRPVTTTRRLLNLQTCQLHSWRRSALKAGLPPSGKGSGLAATFGDVVDGLLHRGDLFRVLVRNFDLEFLFQGHDQFDRVERIGAQVIHKGRSVGDLFGLDPQLLCNNGLYLLFNVAHLVLTLCSYGSAARQASRTRGVL